MKECPKFMQYYPEVDIQDYPELINEIQGWRYCVYADCSGDIVTIAYDQTGFRVADQDKEFQKDIDNDKFLFSYFEHFQYPDLMKTMKQDSGWDSLVIHGRLRTESVRWAIEIDDSTKEYWTVTDIIINGCPVNCYFRELLTEKFGMQHMELLKEGEDIKADYLSINELIEAFKEYPSVIVRPVIYIYSSTLKNRLSFIITKR